MVESRSMVRGESALGKMQGEAAGRAGDSSGEGEEPPTEGLGGHPPGLVMSRPWMRPTMSRAGGASGLVWNGV